MQWVLKSTLLALSLLASARAVCERSTIPDFKFQLRGSNVAFPCESTKNIYLSTGRYIQKNIIGVRMQIFRENAIIAMPRYKPGVPFTVGRFSLNCGDCRPLLEPFPCWAIQEEGNCDALQSVVDLVVDETETLWLLDTGLVNTLEQPVRRCAPKLVGINLQTGQVVKVVDLTQFATLQSRLQYLVVDIDYEGHAYAYVSDAGIGAIIVYDITVDKGYRVVLPKAVATNANDKDVLYMAMVRLPSENLIYFTYLSSPHLFYINTAYLQKGQASGSVVDVGPKPTGKPIVLLGTDNGAAIFFRYKGESDIYIWNTVTCFKPDNFMLVQKGGDCRLSTQVVPGYKRLMWVIESNFHDYITDTVGCLGASVVVHPLIKTCD